MQSRTLSGAAVACVIAALTISTTACTSESEQVAGPQTPQEYFETYNNEFVTAAAQCPDAISPAQLAESIRAASNFEPISSDYVGRRGYAGLTPDTWDRFADENQDPNDLADAIDVSARFACHAASQVRGDKELTVAGQAALKESSKLDVRLSSLTWAVVYAGSEYIHNYGGADFDDPLVGPYLRQVVPADFNT